MAQQTEAACLLDSGAMYGKRILLKPASGQGDPIFAGFRTGVFSLYYGDAPIYHFDRDGRWQRSYIEGTHFLKGLDGTTQAIDRVREGVNLVLKRRTLGYAEAVDLDARIRGAAIELLEAWNHDTLEPIAPRAPTPPLSGDELRDALEQVTRWDANAWFAQRERYLAAYGPSPLPIVPPNAPGPLVVLATLGTTGLARRSPGDSIVRAPGELAGHVSAVKCVVGSRIEQARTVFLAGPDALRQPPEIVSAYLDTIAHALGLPVVGMLDDFRSDGSGPDSWVVYRERGLSRVCLVVESGDPLVRSLYEKQWKNQDLISCIADIRNAGLKIDLLALADAGGTEHAGRHLEATAELLAALPMGPGDLVALLDGEEVRDYFNDTEPRVFTPLPRPDRATQQAELKRRLEPWRKTAGVKVVPYSLEKQTT